MKKRFSIGLASILLIFLSFDYSCPEILGIYFPPYEGAEKPIIQLYDKAGKSIHLAIYSFTKEDMAEGLVRAHKRGVEVKVLIDKGQANDANAKDEMLESAGIHLKRSKGRGSMHNKFCIIDGLIVYTGSFNHTNSATIRNDENYIVIKDKGIAETYERQFQRLWEKHK